LCNVPYSRRDGLVNVTPRIVLEYLYIYSLLLTIIINKEIVCC
jgi:hypothetical protein